MLQKSIELINEKFAKGEITISEFTESLKALSSLNIVNSGTNNSATATTVSGKYSTNLKDYEPKKDDKGFYIWKSLEPKRKAYCYAKATNGMYNKFTKAIDISFEEGSPYKLAKAEFDKAYPYVKQSAR